MQTLGKFFAYQPDNPEFPGANYACNSAGTDWYSVAWDSERIAGKVYVGVDDAGVILSVTDDGSRLFPVNMTVWEMEKNEIPPALLLDWSYASLIDGAFVVDYQSRAESKRRTLLHAVRNNTADWRTELELGVITDEDKASLAEWMACIKALRALDFSGVTDEASYEAISWPAHP